MLDLLENTKKTHHCNELDEKDIGKEVVLMGWVQKRRDHGGVIFIDLRDREGISQVVFNPEENKETHNKAHGIRSEFVLSVKGLVALRPDNMINAKLQTGKIEIIANELKILNFAQTPPFQIQENTEVSENVRLEYRYVDLKRQTLQKNLIKRAKVTTLTRNYLNNLRYLDIETPFLTQSYTRRSKRLSCAKQN